MNARYEQIMDARIHHTHFQITFALVFRIHIDATSDANTMKAAIWPQCMIACLSCGTTTPILHSVCPSQKSHASLSATLSSHDVSTKMLMNTASQYEVVTESRRGTSYFYSIKTAVRKKSGIMRAKMFPHRDSNQGLLSRSRVSSPPRLYGKADQLTQ